MKARQISFALAEITLTSVGARVTGRCCEDPIHVGDVFDLTYQLSVKTNLDGDASAVQHSPREILVRVSAIRSYGQNWTELETGMTGEIDLVGEDAKSLRPAEVLAKTSNLPRL